MAEKGCSLEEITKAAEQAAGNMGKRTKDIVSHQKIALEQLEKIKVGIAEISITRYINAFFTVQVLWV